MLTLSILFALLAAIALVVALLLPEEYRRWVRMGSSVSGALCLVSLSVASFTQVAPSHIGIVTTFGKVHQETLAAGAHFILPVSRVHEVFIGLQPYKVSNIDGGSKDLQSVKATIGLNVRVIPGREMQLFMRNPTINLRAEETIDGDASSYVGPVAKEVFKAVVSQYTAEELVVKRAEVSAAITKALNNKLGTLDQEAPTVNLINFGFSKAFDAAIEEKVTASQKAETAKRNLEKAKFEAEARVAQAEGEAKAIAIQAAAVEKQGGVGYVQLQAIAKWNGVLPTQMLGSAPVPFVNVK